MQVNSKEYWNNRFDTDWNEFSGDKQTEFFAKLLCEQLPSEFVNEVRFKEYSVCDMGCAEGDAISIFSKTLNVIVDGMDFSESAIKKAKEKNPTSNFWVGDLLSLTSEKQYDVAICSNVLEHFSTPWIIFKNLTKIAKEYIVIMVPYKEKLDINEHMYTFSEENIPLAVADFSLCYVRTVDGEKYEDSMYPGQQILLIYKKNAMTSITLGQVTEGIVDSFKREESKRKEEERKIHVEKLAEIRLELNNKEKELQKNEKELQDTEKRLQELSDSFEKNQERLISCENELLELGNIFKGNQERLIACDNAINRARYECRRINNKISYKFLCLFTRFFQQFVGGSWEQKKNFMSICKSFLQRKPDTFSKNDGYNMILNISNILETAGNVDGKQKLPNNVEPSVERELPQVTKDILQQEYTKQDVIFLSVIDYDFRFQRPQHFAKRFATNGHRVFYVNANFVRPDTVTVKEENLYLTDFSNDAYNAIYMMDGQSTLAWMREKFDRLIYNYAIRDAIVVVDYPNWVYGAEYLREQYGFKMITDYMDDYTGFLGTTEDFLKNNCIRLLSGSDAIVVSSQFLADVASKYASPEKIKIVRNGTEVEHFYQATKLKSEDKKRKTIGYYGAVSHWFAWEKVCYLAEKFTDCDIVIVGEITEYRKQLEKYNNIKLLGEKPYSELPKYLADFDVCLIPFDTSTDLIKATNPVKFYEYLSAGKKVVATEIPELEPFRDDYVYMSNDNEKFAEYVRLCLEGNDTLKDSDTCIAFAKENDWQKRYEAFEETCCNCMPKVSVVVLTYNNLALNKECVKSILTKTAYANYELIIVDNQSTDGTIEYLKELEAKKIPNVKIILNDENLGFAGGNNLGIEKADGDYVLLLNNDTIITRGWLTSMVKHLENNKSYGMCNPVTNSIGNESMIAVNYSSKEELDRFAYSYTGMHMNEEYKDVDRLPLFATLIRKSMVEKIGALDASYKVGMFEDDDYTEAALQAGYGIVIVEDAFIHHVNNASFKKLDDEKYRKIFEENKAIFENKWNKKWAMPKYREGVTADCNRGCHI